MWQYNHIPNDNDYLMHYGVKGMKWDKNKLSNARKLLKAKGRKAVRKVRGLTKYGQAVNDMKKWERAATIADAQVNGKRIRKEGSNDRAQRAVYAADQYYAAKRRKEQYSPKNKLKSLKRKVIKKKR